MRYRGAYLTGVLAQLIWAASVIFSKDALQVLDPLSLVVVRFILSVMLMFTIGMVVRHLRPSSSFALYCISKHDAMLFAAAGLLQPFLYFILEGYAIKLIVSPTMAEAFLSTIPLFALLISLLFMHEQITKKNIIGLLVCSIGVALLLFAGNTNFEIGSAIGVVCAFAAVLCAVFYSIILKLIPERYNTLTIVFHVQAFAVLFFIPTWLLVDLPDFATTWQSWLDSGMLGRAFADVLYLGVLASVCAFLMFCYTIRTLGVTRASAFNNITPAFTALLMLIFFGEQLPLLKWIGIVVITVGMFFAQRHEHNKLSE